MEVHCRRASGNLFPDGRACVLFASGCVLALPDTASTSTTRLAMCLQRTSQHRCQAELAKGGLSSAMMRVGFCQVGWQFCQCQDLLDHIMWLDVAWQDVFVLWQTLNVPANSDSLFDECVVFVPRIVLRIVGHVRHVSYDTCVTFSILYHFVTLVQLSPLSMMACSSAGNSRACRGPQLSEGTDGGAAGGYQSAHD